jgi:hypothetical protein
VIYLIGVSVSLRSETMKRVILGIMALCLILASCKSNSDLPIETKHFVYSLDGFRQTYTNDPQYYNNSLIAFYAPEVAPSTSTWEIQCKKISGASSTKFGLVIGDYTCLNFYHIVIDTTGRYCVEKRVGGAWYPIKPWTASDELITGYDKLNAIKVTKSDSIYTIFFNGTEVTTFTDSAITVVSRFGGSASVGVQTAESFPNTPVDVRFKLP